MKKVEEASKSGRLGSLTKKVAKRSTIGSSSIPYPTVSKRDRWFRPLVKLSPPENSRKLIDVSDESDEEQGLRLVLDIKSASDSEAVMAYLYKHTTLEQNFSMNLTALVPDEQGMPIPARLSLVEMLRHFLDFRLITVRKRFEFQLEQLRKRIHILEGFGIIFDGLDKALKIIRNSQGKQDAAEKLMQAFPLDEVQTYAILEIQLYRISQLEIERILGELDEKRAEADRIEKILQSESRLWKVVKSELKRLSRKVS